MLRKCVFDALEGTRDGCFLGEPIRRRPVLPGPAPPRCPAMRRPDPTGPWYLRVLDSAGLYKNSFVRAFGESSRRVVFHNLEGNGDG